MNSGGGGVFDGTGNFFNGQIDDVALWDVALSETEVAAIANGDITSSEKSLEVLRITGVDGLMIGRAAQGRPWIFRELVSAVDNNQFVAPLEKNIVRDIMLDHLSDLYQFYGETTGVRVARKHLIWYCAGLTNTQTFRAQVVRVDSALEQLRLTREFFSNMTTGEHLAAEREQQHEPRAGRRVPPAPRDNTSTRSVI